MHGPDHWSQQAQQRGLFNVVGSGKGATGSVVFLQVCPASRRLLSPCNIMRSGSAGVQKLLFEWCSHYSKVIPFKTAEEGSVRQVGGKWFFLSSDWLQGNSAALHLFSGHQLLLDLGRRSLPAQSHLHGLSVRFKIPLGLHTHWMG